MYEQLGLKIRDKRDIFLRNLVPVTSVAPLTSVLPAEGVVPVISVDPVRCDVPCCCPGGEVRQIFWYSAVLIMAGNCPP